jgi:hypothetical protein
MRIIKYLCTLGILSVMTSSLMADQVMTVGGPDGYGLYQTGDGGEFTLQVINNNSSPDLNAYMAYYADVAKNLVSGSVNFQTFCVEGAEYIYPDTTYDLTNPLGSSTIFSGTELTVGAAYLYYQFATGNLSDYNYADTGAGRETSADLLQKALWYYMGQENQVYDASNPFEVLANTTFASYGTLGAFEANQGLISVSVLSLWSTDFQVGDPLGKRQDQLILTGAQGYSLAPVPDGGTTVGLLGMALTSLGIFRRKESSRG